MWVSCRIRVISWFIVWPVRVITVSVVGVARPANHQFPAARIPVGQRLATHEPCCIGGFALRNGQGSAPQYQRGHSQGQSNPWHISLLLFVPLPDEPES